jgi:hypothetical protein
MVERHLGGRAVARPLAAVTMTVERSLAQDLDAWASQLHSWTWSSSPEQIAAAVDGARRWAADNAWSLDRRVELERSIQWWAFDLTSPGGTAGD